ncbi:MAG: hypothetical protein HYX60_07015 [Legionella longbeachae]|nr:hypothetical protein [Legionella longbeachae]
MAFEKIINELKNTNQTSIDLMDHQLSDENAKEIANVLKINETITSINLSYNQFSDVGVIAIAEALKVNKSIASIDLRYK